MVYTLLTHLANHPGFSATQWDQYYHLRYTVLRQPWGEPLGSERDATDGEPAVTHLGLFSETGSCGGCARVELTLSGEYQVRYVATDDAVRGQGLGRQIMEAVHHHVEAVAAGPATVMLHAREGALGFYTKLGYTLVGPSYVLFGTIQHYQMTKVLPRE